MYQTSFEFDNDEMSYSMMQTFDESDVQDISNIEGVKDCYSVKGETGGDYTWGNVSYFGKTYSATICSDEYAGKQDMLYGQWLNPSSSDKKQIVLNYTAAKKIFKNPKDAIGKGVTFGNTIYEVIGVTEDTSSSMSYAYQCSFISKENIINDSADANYISSIKFSVDENYDKDDIFDKVTELLTNNHPELEGTFKVDDPSQNIALISNVFGGITTFVTAITGIALFVGGVGVMNIMYVSVTERRREIGIRRAIGAKPKSILLQFLFESIIVTGIGGIIGIILGALIGKIAGSLIPIDGFKSVITVKTLIGSASVSILVGVVFGIVPARNASKLDPIKAIYQ